jgi:hypothetical protein
MIERSAQLRVFICLCLALALHQNSVFNEWSAKLLQNSVFALKTEFLLRKHNFLPTLFNRANHNERIPFRAT